MQPFSTLYSRKATGKIQEWKQYIIKNSEKDVWLITEYGQSGGKMTLNRKPIKSTKAKRTPLDEAKAQAESKWNEKVSKEGYQPDIEKAENIKIVRPMLANKYDPEDKKNKNIFPCFGQPKCDGNRAIAYRKNGEIQLMTRNGTSISFFNDIIEELSEMMKHLSDSFHLDGELYTPDLPFNVINGLCNKTKTLSDFDKNNMSKIKYYIFDCFDIENLGLGMKDRLEYLFKLVDSKYKKLVLVETIILKNEKDVEKYHDKYVREGYEGIMLRKMSAGYSLKKRTNDLLKCKKFVEEEFKIVGYTESAEEKGTVIWICETNVVPKSNFNVRPKGDVEYREFLLKNAKNYIGQLLTVIYQEFTDNKHGIPRFPVGKDIRYKSDLS